MCSIKFQFIIAQTYILINTLEEIFVEGWRKRWLCGMWQAGRLYIQTLKTTVLLVGKHPKPFEQRFTLTAALRA